VTRDELIALLETPDPLRAAELAGVVPGSAVTYSRTPPPSGWFRDVDREEPVSAHRAAHARGVPSEAIVAYGAGTPAAETVDRLRDLAELARETGLLRAVSPRPGDGTTDRPGSWGVEDLVVIGMARHVLPDDVQVRPDWRRLGAAASQIAVAFGATDWQLPADDDTDVEWLVASVGFRAVLR
jgi:aminodeoxyfutalosine synthase